MPMEPGQARFRLEALVCVAVALAASVAGWLHPYAWQQSIAVQHTYGPDAMVPAVMWAAGHGMRVPLDSNLPGLQDFLFRGAATLDVNAWPANIDTREPNFFYNRHKVLFYIVGITWAVFGISWDALKIPILLGFAVSASLVYGTARLYMGRPLSVAVALLWVMTPGVLASLYMIRDFSKVPFILAALFLSLLFVRNTMPYRTLCGFALLLGGVIGFGTNLRQDVLICLPPAVAIAFLGTRSDGLRIRGRVVLAALVFLAFAIAAGPYRATDRNAGSEMWHHLTMGWSTAIGQEMALAPGDYAFKPLYSDTYAMRVALHHTEARTNINYDFGFLSRESGEGQRAYIQFLMTRFPADFLLRGYAATLWVLRGARTSFDTFLNPPIADYDPGRHWHGWLTRPMHHAGPALAVLLLLLLACRSPREAILTGLVLLYFCSYISLQFGYRHAFHLAFIPYFILAATVHAGAVAARSRAWRLAGIPAARRRLALAVALLAGAAAILAGLLAGARAWQTHQVLAIADTVRALPRTPVATRQIELDSWTLFAPENLVDGRRRSLYFAESRVHAAEYPMHPIEYLVVALLPGNEPVYLSTVYEATNFLDDFSSAREVAAVDARVHLYFFPIYEKLHTGQWRRFAGISVPSNQAKRIAGVHRVDARGVPESVLYMVLPEIDPPARTYATIDDAGIRQAWAAMRSTRLALHHAYHLVPQQDWGALLDAMSELVGQEAALPSVHYFRAMARAASGDPQGARADIAEALRQDPSFPPFLKLAGEILEAEPGAAQAFWSGLMDSTPDKEVVERYLALHGHAQGTPDYLRAYQQAALYAPDDAVIAARLFMACAPSNDCGNPWSALAAAAPLPAYMHHAMDPGAAMPAPLAPLDDTSYRSFFFWTLDAAVKEEADALALRILHDLEAWQGEGRIAARDIVEDLLRDYEERDLPTLRGRLEDWLQRRIAAGV